MKQTKAIVFDLYGTLFDVLSVRQMCDKFYPGRGDEMSRLWRTKQIEYTWLRSLINEFKGFEKATLDGLIFTCKQLNLELDEEKKAALLNAYLSLDAFPEVPDALVRLRKLGIPLAILSNGTVHSIDQVVSNAGLKSQFDNLISVDEVGIHKPHTSVYDLVEKHMNCARDEVVFVSCNGWDAACASLYGFNVCWINRVGNIFEELDTAPAHITHGIDGVADWVESLQKQAA